MLLVECVIVSLALLSTGLVARDCDERSLDIRGVNKSLGASDSAGICRVDRDAFYGTAHPCTYEVRPENSSRCTVVAANASAHCGGRDFDVGSVCGDPGACGVYVNVMLDHSFNSHIVKINMANEFAASTSFRYSVYPRNVKENELRDRCVDFSLHEAASRDNPVLFDCNMRRIENVGTRFLLDYMVEQQYGQILLKIPHGMELARGLVPFYAHVVSNKDGTLSLRRLRMTVTFQAYLDAALANGLQPLYQITLYQRECENCTWTLNAVATVNISDPSTYVNSWRNLYTVEVGSSLSSGMYNLTVLPVCSEYGPPLTNFDYSLEFSIRAGTMSGLGIAGLCALVVVLLAGLCQLLYFAYTLKLFVQRRTAIRTLGKKTLYIIYKDVSQEHTFRVSALRQFLIRHMNVTVWMDRHNMIMAKELDPHSWSARCVGEADYVAVVAPPADTNNDDNYRPLYPLNFAMGCQQLDMRLKSLLSTNQSVAKKLCTIISLPGSQISLVPKQLRLYDRFVLPEESTKFEYYIWHEELKMTQLDLCFKLGCVPWCTGKTDAQYEELFETIVAELQLESNRHSLRLLDGPMRTEPTTEEISEDDSEKTGDDPGLVFYEGNEVDDESSDCCENEDLVIGGHVIRQADLNRVVVAVP